jgi:integrase
MLFKDTNLRKIPFPEKATYLYDSAYTGKGSFCLRLPAKSKSKKQQALTFVFKYKIKIDDKYKIQLIKIGQFPAYKCDEARRVARKYSDMLKQGIDPKKVIEAEKAIVQKELEQKQIEEAKGTLEELVNAYLTDLDKQGKRTGGRVLKTIEADVYPILGRSIRACEVTPKHIKNILATMIQRGAPIGSNRVRSNLSAIFNFGLKFDHDPANFGHETVFHLQGNPVASVPKQKVEQPENNFLNISEVYHLLSLNTAQYFTPDTFLLIQLCFHLAGQRPYELVASKWSEVDFTAKTFEIADHISKTKKPHLLPLTDSAFVILEKLHALSGTTQYIFPRPTKSGHLETEYFSHCLRKFCMKTGFKKFIPRDIRRTCKTLMGEIGLSKDIRDRLQNHSLHDVSSRHYDRYSYFPEKLKALEAWEARLNTTHATSNVIAIGA